MHDLSWFRGSLLRHIHCGVFWAFVHECTQQEDGWAMQLLAVTCLSLAAKMEETLVPSLLDLQARQLGHTSTCHACHSHYGYTFNPSTHDLLIKIDEHCPLNCIAGGGHQQIRLRPRDGRPDGAHRPDGAQLAAPVGYSLHLHRLLRVQGRSRREAHQVPHCPGHASDSGCNAW